MDPVVLLDLCLVVVKVVPSKNKVGRCIAEKTMNLVSQRETEKLSNKKKSFLQNDPGSFRFARNN